MKKLISVFLITFLFPLPILAASISWVTSSPQSYDGTSDANLTVDVDGTMAGIFAFGPNGVSGDGSTFNVYKNSDATNQAFVTDLGTWYGPAKTAQAYAAIHGGAGDLRLVGATVIDATAQSDAFAGYAAFKAGSRYSGHEAIITFTAATVFKYSLWFPF